MNVALGSLGIPTMLVFARSSVNHRLPADHEQDLHRSDDRVGRGDLPPRSNFATVRGGWGGGCNRCCIEFRQYVFGSQAIDASRFLLRSDFLARWPLLLWRRDVRVAPWRVEPCSDGIKARGAHGEMFLRVGVLASLANRSRRMDHATQRALVEPPSLPVAPSFPARMTSTSAHSDSATS